MRVLIVLETSGGGSGRHAVDLAAGLASAGHEVHVLYSRVRAEARFEHALRSVRGIAVDALDMARMFGPGDVGAMRLIRRYVAAHGPFDIVHGHSTKAIIACVATADLPVGRIFTPHALRSSDPTLPAPARIACGLVESLLARFATAVIAVSEEEWRHARRIGIPSRKLRLVANGIAGDSLPSRPEARRRLGIAADDVCIGFVGRLARQKAPHRLIEAAAAIVAAHPNLRVCFVGDGPLDVELRALAQRLGIAGRIVWCGPANGQAAMPAFDVFALPSLYEGMPYVLLEAAAAGLPIVAADVGGVRTVVIPGRNGIIVSNWDGRAFAAHLADLAADPARCAAMGAASREIARGFTIERMIAETIAVYQSARPTAVAARQIEPAE
jgi:glycosyltransferase involved in cell wall biosynthesis